MGSRLNVQKKRVVEYDHSGYFNYQNVEFHNILDSLCVFYTGEEWDDEFEVERNSLEKGLKELENIRDGKEYSDDINKEDLDCYLKECEMTIDKLVDCFKFML